MCPAEFYQYVSPVVVLQYSLLLTFNILPDADVGCIICLGFGNIDPQHHWSYRMLGSNYSVCWLEVSTDGLLCSSCLSHSEAVVPRVVMTLLSFKETTLDQGLVRTYSDPTSWRLEK